MHVRGGGQFGSADVNYFLPLDCMHAGREPSQRLSPTPLASGALCRLGLTTAGWLAGSRWALQKWTETLEGVPIL